MAPAFFSTQRSLSIRLSLNERMSAVFISNIRKLLEAERRQEKLNELRKTAPQIPCLGENCPNKIDSKYSVSICDKCRDDACEMNGGKMKLFCQAVLNELPPSRCRGTVKTGSWFCSRHQGSEMYPHDPQEAERMVKAGTKRKQSTIAEKKSKK